MSSFILFEIKDLMKAGEYTNYNNQDEDISQEGFKHNNALGC